MRRVRRRWLAAAAAALACGPLATSPLATGAAAAAPAPAVLPIAALQARLVAGAHQPAVLAASGALAADLAALATASDRQSADRSATADAASAVGADAAHVAAATAALTAATAAVDATTAAVASDRDRLAGIAVGLYVDPALARAPAPAGDDVGAAQARAEAVALVEIVTSGEEHRLDADRATLDADRRRAASDTAGLGAARADLARATALRDQRAALLAGDAASVASATGAVGAEQAALAAAQASLAQALAAVAGPAGVPDDGSPSIMGAAALTAGQISAWYARRGGVDLTAVPVSQLAAWYLAEGAAQGVRGDVAFAQAMVETGGFSSTDAVEFNNYAGIGHCDSCAAGLAFPSPALGVRGQIQLLASYASPTLTAATLAEPLVLAPLAPEAQPDKGCCRTWQELTGTWASDPLYGQTVMAMYRSMLTSAISPSG